jgi:hypothetical protein
VKSNPTLMPEGQIYPLLNLCPQDNYQPFFFFFLKIINVEGILGLRFTLQLFVPKRRRLKENKVFFFGGD